MGNSASKQWKLRADQIRFDRDNKVKVVYENVKQMAEKLSISPTKTQRIITANVVELVDMLNKGETTSEELVIVFSLRCFTIGLEKCWMTEENFQEALKAAKECDEIRATTKKMNRTIDNQDPDGLPELFGVPISIKDTFDIKGMASTIGATARYDFKFPEDGLAVQVIKRAGAIPFVKSNVPQLAMTYESINKMWGRAVNPWDQTRAVGGSSGGEGALVAGRCSPLGLGSDIGGSIRIPAEFCGVYGFKPSSFRVTVKGHTFFEKSIAGMINIPLAIGPIGKSVDDLTLMMKALSDPQYYPPNHIDVYIKLQSFDFKLYRTIPTKMRIGYFDTLRLIPTTAASKRAVHQSIKHLQSLGHQIVEVELPDQDQLIGSFYEFVAAQGDLRGYKEILEGEQLIKEYKTLNRVFSMPPWMVGCLSTIVKKSKPRLGYIMSKSASKDAHEYFKLSDRQQKHKRAFVEMWKQHKLDVMIGPGFGSQAQKHGFSEQANLSAAYTFIWNVLQTPTGAMPITRVTAEQQTYPQVYNDPINTKLVENVRGSTGLPVGIQVVGLPFQDQLVLGVMNLLQSHFNFYKTHPFPK